MRLVGGSEGGRDAVGGNLIGREGKEAFIRRFAIKDIPRWGGGNHVLLVYFFDRTTPDNYACLVVVKGLFTA